MAQNTNAIVTRKKMALENSAEGAKEARFIIKKFHSCLNSSKIVPSQAYRRNSVTYSLICYVNCITGAFLSKNYNIIPIFVQRAARHMEEFPPYPATEEYYDIVFSYLAQITYYILSFVNLDPSDIALLPQKAVDAGKQKAPR